MNTETWTRVKEILDACLDLDPEQRPRYLDDACANEPEVRAEVESLLAAHEEAGDFIASPVLRETFVGARLGPWKILTDIGEGGMCRVCLAERADGQFEQRAAVKIVKRGMDSDLILRHFQMERQILAGMRHPNIARLLDGGVTPSGRPYFVMEHIEGERIDEYGEAKNLNTADQLKLFQQVCSAVHYAHQRLVVHRDIKPSNILVTSDGTAKLLDFGIATILSAEPALGTLSSTQLLTPDYASPEQIRGEVVTTASDVYSLGVLLYRLLTGRSPYAATTASHEMARAICELEPKSPSLASDLDNIVLKSLEKDPALRYASAEQFSQDIGRYLAGRPVFARPHTWRYRTTKFVTRNKIAVAAGMVMVVLLIGGMAATLWQARIARAERKRAEQQFFETRQLANSLLFEVHDAIRDLPGSTKARALIVEKSVQYLDRISAESPGNGALQLELAEGYKRLGDVLGRTNDANLGEYASAEKSYRKALALLQSGSAKSVDRQRQRSIAILQLRLATPEETAQAVTTFERLRKAEGDSRQTLGDLASGYSGMANVLVERRDLPNALEYRLKERAIQKQISEMDVTNITATRNYALASKKLGALLWKMDRLADAIPYYETALELEEAWLAREPSSTDAKMAISFSHSDIGFFLREQNKIQAALEHYRITIKLREELLAADPNDARARLAVVSAFWRTSLVAADARESKMALDLLGKAVKTLAESKNPAPSTARSRAELAHIYAAYGDVYSADGRATMARGWRLRSVQLLTDMRSAGELDAGGADLLSRAAKKLAR